jgi:hypothetical protein
VVVAVLSAVALAAFGMMTEDRAQARMEDTRTRLSMLRRATLGVEAPAYGGETRLSGFVADNGRLPESVADLLAPPTGYAWQMSAPASPPEGFAAARAPELASELDAYCLPKEGDSPDALDEMAARLIKGHRGRYLAGLAQNDVFRDGWGNYGDDPDPAAVPGLPESAAADSRNFGWRVVLDPADTDDTDKTLSQSLEITSLGADNAENASTGSAAEADIGMEIRPEDWQVSLKGWTITLTNKSGSNVLATHFENAAGPAGKFGDLGVTLLVFENTPDAEDKGGTKISGRWRHFRAAADSSCADKATLADGESCEFAFAETVACGASGTIKAQVPLGRHLLLLAVNNRPLDASKYSAASKPDPRRLWATADFYPGVLQPALRWELR